MIKGDLKQVEEIVRGRLCAKHQLPVGFTYDPVENTYEVVCPMGHYPDEAELTGEGQPAAAGKIRAITDVLPDEVIRGNLIPMEEVIGREIVVTNFTLKDSAFAEDQQYLSMEIALDGRPYILNTGAERILSAFRLLEHEDLPVSVTFETAKTVAGRRIYRIKSGEEPPQLL